MSTKSYSIVEYYAEQEGYKCGYCQSTDTNFSHGMWAHSLTVQDYQDLIDRGWRRSGSYCYKPTMDRTCCPAYTIKCETEEFNLSKSQKKVLKKMSRFLRNEMDRDVAMDRGEGSCRDDTDVQNLNERIKRARKNASDIRITSVVGESAEKLRLSVENAQTSSEVPPDVGTTCATSKTDNAPSLEFAEKKSTLSGATAGPQEKFFRELNSSTYAETSSEVPPDVGMTLATSKTDNAPSLEHAEEKPTVSGATAGPKKAKLMRLERKQNKLLAQGKSREEIDVILKEKKPRNNAKTLEDFFRELNDSSKKLEMRLVRTSPISSEYLKSSKESYRVYKMYQTTIHEVQASNVTERQYTRFLVESPLQMKLVRVMSEEFLETFDESAKLYRKYQMAIHKDPPDDCNKKSFYNFLVKSPLQECTPENGPSQGYGSFHEQYWLDNTLIAVGVIDILPYCVSSVYFFYDPAYSHLSLGSFSSIREVQLTRQLNKIAPSLKYYYMGFYIHTCPKMRYKARMKPSKLLCPETYVWCGIERCLPKLDREKYCRLNEDLDAIDENGIVDIDLVLLVYREAVMSYRVYKERIRQRADENEIREYASLVGMKCAQSLILYRR